mgnify:CR=1 FL=1
MTHVFECLSCGATTDPDERPAGCPECGGHLEVAYEALPEDLSASDRTDLWRYADWLPTAGLELASGSRAALAVVVIAEVGASGRVTGAHLDWRINWFDKRLDPSLLAGPMPAAKTRQANRGG